MITTVVTATTITTVITTTTVTTVTTIIAMGLGAAVSAVAIAGFGIFLGTKELVGANRSASSVRLARFLSVGIWPLAIAFGVFAAMKIVQLVA